jgi:hypothetical protein
MIKKKGKINGKILLKYIEREYEKNIEEKLYIKPN